MSEATRLHQILERIRAKEFPDLRKGFVAQIADIQERNVFDDQRAGAKKELRSLLEIEIQSGKMDDKP